MGLFHPVKIPIFDRYFRNLNDYSKKKLYDDAKPTEFMSKSEKYALLDHDYALHSDTKQISSASGNGDKKVNDTSKNT